LGGARGRLITSDDREKTLQLIHDACLSGTRKKEACKLLHLSVRTIERWEKDCGINDKRQTNNRIPSNKLTQEERDMIILTANSETYRDLPPCKIVPMLADNNRYIASESSFYRILRENNQLTHRSRSKPAKHHKPDPFTATRANQVWTWDISYLPTQVGGLYFYLYMIVDIFSRKIVGFSIHESESSLYASHLIEQACHDEKILLNQLILHSDNGSSMKGITMIAMLQKLGVIPSFSRPSVSNDNPYSESLFKTVKYHPTYPAVNHFETIADARIWCEKFVTWYNQEHLHSALKFITPQQRHNGEDKIIMQKRHTVYQNAKQKHPERWSKNTRNWTLPKNITLNPNKKKEKEILEKSVKMVNAAVSTYPQSRDSTKNHVIVGKYERSDYVH
jgi:putative transposase